MADDTKKGTGSVAGISLPPCSDLRGKQSIRATFKLSEKSIEIISVVASRLGIKQKSLFDHLIDDMNKLTKNSASKIFFSWGDHDSLPLERPS